MYHLITFILLSVVGVVVVVHASENIYWAIELNHETTDPHVFAMEHHLEFVHNHTFLKGIFLFKSKQSQDQYQLESRLASDPQVAWSQRQIPRKQHKRTLLAGRYGDPAYARQWHLHDPPHAGNGVSIKADKAWSKGVTGRGITIAIVDDGVEMNHPDLKGNIDRQKSWNFNYNKADTTPASYNGHGTAAAGVAAAVRNNGHCGSGAAPNSKLVGEVLIAEACSDYTESMALSHHSNSGVDIYSCSWGPSDDASNLIGPGRLMKLVLERGVSSGRNGKGSIFMWAGGNGKQHNDVSLF